MKTRLSHRLYLLHIQVPAGHFVQLIKPWNITGHLQIFQLTTIWNNWAAPEHTESSGEAQGNWYHHTHTHNWRLCQQCARWDQSSWWWKRSQDSKAIPQPHHNAGTAVGTPTSTVQGLDNAQGKQIPPAPSRHNPPSSELLPPAMLQETWHLQPCKPLQCGAVELSQLPQSSASCHSSLHLW